MRIKEAIIAAIFCLAGCVGMPETVRPVEQFELERYLGAWYEIARLDHSFERGLSRVTAEYSLREDGGVRVVNRGWSERENRWKEAEGRAYFVERPDLGFLKVSFFGPFYGSYIVFELDRDEYSYALVSGPNLSYLWLLARSPWMEKETKDWLLESAERRGFDISGIIHVDHGDVADAPR